MQQPDFRTGATYAAGTTDIAVQQNKVLRNTYLLLAISLIPTVIGAAVGTNFINFSFMRASPIMSALGMLVVFYGWIFAGHILSTRFFDHAFEAATKRLRRADEKFF